MVNAARQPNFALLLAVAWALTAAWLLLQFWPDTASTFSDPDDAMRLVEMRAFLHGRGWFDLAEPRLDPSFGYLSHWSRLIDAGLAGLVVVFRQVADAGMAERLTRAVWPLIWLLPAMGAAAAIAWRIAGRDAALVALLLAVFGLPAFQQFKPGRIDHHNVQIVLALLTVAAAAWSDRKRFAATAAGIVSGLAVAVGLESLPWVALAGLAIALRFVIAGSDDGALMRYGLALSASVAAAFLVSVPPARWTIAACDAIALNVALPAVAGGVLLAVAGYRFAAADRRRRMLAVGVAGAVAAVLFVALEPRCLGGPFALIDPAARPLWLADVREMEPLALLMRDAPVMGAWVSAFPLAALAMTLALLHQPQTHRDLGSLLAATSLALGVLLTVLAVKSYSYAMWFGMPLVAAGAVVLFARWQVSRPLRFLAAAVLTPVAISASAVTIAQAAAPALPVSQTRQACFNAESYAPLARLPVGLIAADVDYGPLLLAFTPHSVLAAPYHRLSHGVIVAHRALAEPPEAARRVLREANVDYVVLCGSAQPTGLGPAERTAGLWAHLVAGDVPAWLIPLPSAPGDVFTAYRVVR